MLWSWWLILGAWNQYLTLSEPKCVAGSHMHKSDLALGWGIFFLHLFSFLNWYDQSSLVLQGHLCLPSCIFPFVTLLVSLSVFLSLAHKHTLCHTHTFGNRMSPLWPPKCNTSAHGREWACREVLHRSQDVEGRHSSSIYLTSPPKKWKDRFLGNTEWQGSEHSVFQCGFEEPSLTAQSCLCFFWYSLGIRHLVGTVIFSLYVRPVSCHGLCGGSLDCTHK